ncbi:MAG: hypothetical protein CO189_02760 [candidate division Zixibacteria bacterium CG_4_9_14_3_um_filter_46_8]|nr:MAG: hypothetical protein CO189_02760 [candidate division Zixibacteria bacterium CG_4_9_14_3_um_filter_46_8]
MMKILVVDDDKVNLLSISEAFRGKEYDIITSASLQEAKKYLESDSSIMLVICDTAMRSEDGENLLDYLKSNLKFKHLPVIVCSTFHSSNSVEEALKKGAKDLVSKPINPNALRQKVENIIDSSKGRILIVDDDQFILEILKTILEREGYSTLTANSGESALETIKSNPINLIISDIIMPGMNGMELLANVKSNYPSIPVLMITGYSGKYSNRSVTAQGAKGCVTKPFKNTEIVNRVKDLI